MMPPIDSTPSSSAITTLAGDSVYSRRVERQHLFAFPGTADRQVARDLRRVEDMQRPALVEGQVIGDIDQRVDRAEADGSQPLAHPGGARAVFHAAHEAKREAGAEMPVLTEIEADLDGRLAFHREGRRRSRLQGAETGCREIAGDAVDAGAIRPVRGQVYLDDRVVEAA